MSIPFSEMTGSFEVAALATAETLGHFHLRRRFRSERRDWNRAAANINAPGAVRRDFTDLPYLVAHPEREIAEARGIQWHCEACRVTDGYSPFTFEPGRYVAKAIAAAHAHNAARHPRRWLRSQHGQVDPYVALDEARRVTSWGADA